MRSKMLKRALVIALIVGTLLNIINQYDAFTQSAEINWLKAILTYCVPFIVSLLSAWLASKDNASISTNRN